MRVFFGTQYDGLGRGIAIYWSCPALHVQSTNPSIIHLVTVICYLCSQNMGCDYYASCEVRICEVRVASLQGARCKLRVRILRVSESASCELGNDEVGFYNSHFVSTH